MGCQTQGHRHPACQGILDDSTSLSSCQGPGSLSRAPVLLRGSRDRSGNMDLGTRDCSNYPSFLLNSGHALSPPPCLGFPVCREVSSNAPLPGLLGEWVGEAV